MSVRIYSRLGDLLQSRGLSTEDLRALIADRFGVAVDPRTLAGLARDARVRRPDLEVAWTAAAVLDARLDDVFLFEQTLDSDDDQPTTADGIEPTIGEGDVLDPEQSRRLRALYALQGRRALTDDEWAEMDELVAEWNHRTYEQGVRGIAERDGRSVEQVMADLAAQRARIADWYRELEANPARREALVQEALERQRARAAR